MDSGTAAAVSALSAEARGLIENATIDECGAAVDKLINEIVAGVTVLRLLSVSDAVLRPIEERMDDARGLLEHALARIRELRRDTDTDIPF